LRQTGPEPGTIPEKGQNLVEFTYLNYFFVKSENLHRSSDYSNNRPDSWGEMMKHCVSCFCFGGRNICKVSEKVVNFLRLFKIFTKIVLDKCLQGWYYNEARVGGICGFSQETQKRNFDDAGDCSSDEVTSAEYVRSSGG
jgi:hypothetical protein